MSLRQGIAAAFAALAIGGTALVGGSAFGQERYVYSHFDKAWIDGLASGLENVVSRMARMQTGQDASSKEDICGCEINARGDIVDPGRCPVVFETRDDSMAKVLPVALVTSSDWAFNLACFKEGAPGCRSAEGASYIGETCCRMVDMSFSHGKSDLNFYLLAPAPVAMHIAAYRYGELIDSKPVYPGCALLVDDQKMLWSLPQTQTGFVARTWLYAVQHFGANAPYALGVLKKMSVLYPPTVDEIERAKRIAVFQGRGNREILGQ